MLVKRRPFVASLLWALGHLDGWRCHVFIGHLAENVAQAIQAGAALVIRLHGELWGFRDMRLGKHGVLRSIRSIRRLSDWSIDSIFEKK